MKVEDHHRTILDMKIKKALNPFYHKNIFDRSNNRLGHNWVLEYVFSTRYLNLNESLEMEMHEMRK